MGQKPDAKLTPEIARELCQRTGSAAVLNGSIAQIGTQYLLTLKAVNCSSGETLASTGAQASDKNRVLDALGKTASDIRNKLGESLSTVRKFDTPLEQATTPSLEALQAFSSGWRSLVGGDSAAAVPLFERAIKLDPNFAMAYRQLGVCYINLGESSLAIESTRKAFELRGRVSERERLAIEANYYFVTTGDTEKVKQSLEVWAQTYPRDWLPRTLLGVVYELVGQYDKSLAEFRESFRLSSQSGLTYANIVGADIFLNRLDEARTTIEEAIAKNLDSPLLRFSLYMLAFLQDDTAAMGQQVRWSAGKPGVEDVFLANEADTAAYLGQIKKAREFSRQATVSAERAGKKETAQSYKINAALREALFGNTTEARQRVNSALGPSMSQDEQNGAALALSFIGDTVRGQSLADDLAMRFPQDTIVQFSYLPTLRAQLALNRDSPLKAIEVLQPVLPYELGTKATLYPAYVRGEAYLAARQSKEAAVEFQKILDHRGVVVNGPIGALAHLGLARAYALQGDTAKAKAAYQDFLTLWKDADADIPVLVGAKSEYAKLK